ncbi:MAG TPA: sigma factor [Trebonia sp.]|nr:sigma factor [Trebonia sp.]
MLDEARFAELSERHRRELQVHRYRMPGSLEQAGDAVQEALLRARRDRVSFDGGPGARAWLYRIFTTARFGILRTARRRGGAAARRAGRRVGRGRALAAALPRHAARRGPAEPVRNRPDADLACTCVHP